MKTSCLLLAALLSFFSSAQAAKRYWIHKVLYENHFSTSAQLGEWNLIEDNGTGGFTLSPNGTAILKMDNATGNFANRLFSVNGASSRFLSLDRMNGRVEINIKILTGGNQRLFVQAQQFDASNTYIDQIDILPAQSNTGFFSINFNSINWAANADKIRFIIGGENYSGQQGTMEFDYFSYSNDNGNWSNTANWSTTSNGISGASAPGASDTAIFDGAGSSNGSCLFDQHVAVSSMQVTSGYVGNIDQQSYNLTIGTGGFSMLNGGLTAGNGNITVSGSFIAADNILKATAGIFELRGNLVLTNTVFNNNNGTVKLSGTDNQQVSVANQNFYNLTIDKSSGSVEMLANSAITNTLSLVKGNINTNAYTLTLGSGAGNTGTLNYLAGRINGKLNRWYGTASTGAVLYPMGSAGTNASFTINVVTAPSAGGTAAVEFIDNTPTFSNANFADGGVLIAKVSSSYWNVSTNFLREGGFSLHAVNNNLPPYNSVNELHLVNANGITGSHAAGRGSVGNPVINRTGITAATLQQSYYVGTTVPQSLPLTWISFTTEKQSNLIVLAWQTEQELNIDHFNVETSSDGIHFHKQATVNTMDAASNRYRYSAPVSTLTPCYYRIAAIDMDGKISYSSTRYVQGKESFSVKLYPVPAASVLTLTTVTSLKNNLIYIYSCEGKKLKEMNVTGTTHNIDLADMKTGCYYLCLYDESKKLISQKMFVVNR